MRWIVLRSLPVVMLLSACSWIGSTTSGPSEATEPDDEAPEPEARISVERHSGYGDDWDAAYDAILAIRLHAFARLGVRRVVLSPHAVGGNLFPHIVRVHLHFDDGDSKGIAVVANGQVLERNAGPDGLAAYLAGLGFPRELQPAPLLTELVCYFEGTIDNDPWCSAAAETPRADARVERRAEGAVLVLEAVMIPSPDEGGEIKGELRPVPHRLAIRFDGEARPTVHQFRQRPDGSWKPTSLE